MTVAAALLPVAADVSFVLLLLAIVGCFVRVVRGPSLPDRVIALDLLSMTLVAFAGLYAVTTRERAFLDVSLALALVAFFTTVAFARYVLRRRAPSGGEADAADAERESS
jgi:multicomponent Na+:H+ antiporter subunit F